MFISAVVMSSQQSSISFQSKTKKVASKKPRKSNNEKEPVKSQTQKKSKPRRKKKQPTPEATESTKESNNSLVRVYKSSGSFPTLPKPDKDVNIGVITAINRVETQLQDTNLLLAEVLKILRHVSVCL